MRWVQRRKESTSRNVRLNKFLARCGVTSRRKADDLIAIGRVAVNGEPVTEMGVRINPDSDTVSVDGAVVSLPESYVYYLLHKPQDVVTTVSDPHGRKTVVDLIPTDRRIYPVGRLDYDTTGVLLLTDDGEFAQQMTHPSYEIDRTYEVTYQGHLPSDAKTRVRKGLDIGDDQPVQGELSLLWEKEHHGAAHLTLHTGKYHEVKRIFTALDCEVQRLHRIKFGEFSCGELAPGEYRQLSQDEVQYLKSWG